MEVVDGIAYEGDTVYLIDIADDDSYYLYECVIRRSEMWGSCLWDPVDRITVHCSNPKEDVYLDKRKANMFIKLTKDVY